MNVNIQTIMSHDYLAVALLLVVLAGTRASGTEDLSRRVETALQRAGENAAELRAALDAAPEEHKEGIRFLVAYMPERDLRSLSAEYLLKNTSFAYRAWNEAPWKDKVTPDMFLNDVLPYAVISERRDDWREEFYTKFKPLVAEAGSPGRAAVILNNRIYGMLNVHFSRRRPKTDMSPNETIEVGRASCTGMSILLVAACRAVGVPARFAGTPLWPDGSGNHSWVEVWDGEWHYTGGGEPAGDALDRAWFTGKAGTSQRDSRLHAIYAASFKPTGTTFPLSWNRSIDYVHGINVTERYAPAKISAAETAPAKAGPVFDVEASLHAVAQLKKYLETTPADRKPLAEKDFATVSLTRDDAGRAQQLLWEDHVRIIRETRAKEMKARVLTEGHLRMPFDYSVAGDKPANGRSLYITLHGGGGTTKRVNDSQWEIHKRLYRLTEGILLAPRAPTDSWNMWHQGHVDTFLGRLIENMIVFEDVDPNRVYLSGVSAGGDGVYYLAPRMADRFAAATMVAGHPNTASPLGLRNLPFSIQMGANDSAYNRNNVAREWGRRLDDLQKNDPEGYIHWTQIHEGKGHGLRGLDAASIPWMAKYTRNPLPDRIVWRQENHKRFYWLATNSLHPGAVARATRDGQRIDLQPGGIKQIIIRANDSMLNLDEEVTVISNGKEVFKGRVERNIETIAKTLAERGDPAALFCAEFIVDLE